MLTVPISLLNWARDWEVEKPSLCWNPKGWWARSQEMSTGIPIHSTWHLWGEQRRREAGGGVKMGFCHLLHAVTWLEVAVSLLFGHCDSSFQLANILWGCRCWINLYEFAQFLPFNGRKCHFPLFLSIRDETWSLTQALGILPLGYTLLLGG